MDGEKDVTLLPPLTMEPSLDAEYQSMVWPLGTVALNVTVPLPQRALLLAPVGTLGAAFTVTTAALAFVAEHPAAVFTYSV
jgi:hypothetical protein